MEEHNRSFEPMDVDISAHSNSKMDISYESYDDFPVKIKQEHDMNSTLKVNTTFQATPVTNIKKFHIELKKNLKDRNVNKIRIITALFVLLLSILLFIVLNVNCSVDINIENLRNTLSSQLFGQAKAIDSIIESLGEREKSNIIFFYGGTGVGKTFTASILMDSFGYSSNLYHYISPSFVKSMSTDLMMGLIFCSNSLIIIDDCDSADMNLSKEVYNLITKSENLGKNITVVLIYNCDNIGDSFVKSCDKDFHSKLLQSFSDTKVMKRFIKFESLSEVHLRKCIEKELGNKSINEQGYETISKNFDVTVDGCKGVHTKIKLLNIM